MSLARIHARRTGTRHPCRSRRSSASCVVAPRCQSGSAVLQFPSMLGPRPPPALASCSRRRTAASCRSGIHARRLCHSSSRGIRAARRVTHHWSIQELLVLQSFTLCRPRMPRPELPHPCGGLCGSIRRRIREAVTAGQLFCLFRGTGNPTSRRTEFVSLTGSRIFQSPGRVKN